MADGGGLKVRKVGPVFARFAMRWFVLIIIAWRKSHCRGWEFMKHSQPPTSQSRKVFVPWLVSCNGPGSCTLDLTTSAPCYGTGMRAPFLDTGKQRAKIARMMHWPKL